jgi:predicted DNA-binding ribbon-helix-helix protein
MPIAFTDDRSLPILTEASMKSAVLKRSIVVAGHKTSVSLEDAFWSGLKEISKRHKATLSDMVADIDSQRQFGNLSSAIRLFVLEQARAQMSSSANHSETGPSAPRGTQDTTPVREDH